MVLPEETSEIFHKRAHRPWVGSSKHPGNGPQGFAVPGPGEGPYAVGSLSRAMLGKSHAPALETRRSVQHHLQPL